MTMSRDMGEISYECDTPDCNTTLDVVTDNFDVAEQRLYRAGWRTREMAGDVYHYCAACVEEGV